MASHDHRGSFSPGARLWTAAQGIPPTIAAGAMPIVQRPDRQVNQEKATGSQREIESAPPRRGGPNRHDQHNSRRFRQSPGDI